MGEIRIVSYDGTAINDTTNYRAHFPSDLYSSPQFSAAMVGRTNAHPLLGNIERNGRQFLLRVDIYSGSRNTITRLFDPEAGQAKALVATLSDGESGYVMAYCENIKQVSGAGTASFVMTMRLHGDVYWRKTTATTVSDSLTASGDTIAVSNGGDMEAYPVITITPTSAKASGNGNEYRRFIKVEWPFAFGARNHPVDIVGAGLDTQIATTNFASATGDDIRVYRNGQLIDFWPGNINAATTRLWANLDFEADVALTLNGGIGAGDTTLTFNEDITRLPSKGLLLLNSGEVVVYASKNAASRSVSGVARGAKSTTAAIQADGTAVKWLQHDLTIAYGDGALAAYSADDTKKPVFNLNTSTNTSLVYSGEFGDDMALRTGGWQPSAGLGNGTADAGYCYTRDHSVSGTAERVSPWDTAGVAQNDEGVTRFWLHNPRGISAANITGGKTKTAVAAAAASFARVETSADGNAWVTELAIAATTDTQWTAFAQNLTGLFTSSTKETKYVSLTVEEGAEDAETYKAQITAVTITLQNGITVGVGSEAAAYETDLIITNDTTGDSFRIKAAVGTGVAIEIDCDNYTVKRMDDGSSLFSALEQIGGVRERILTLAVGSNTLSFVEAGLAGMDIDIKFRERYFD